MLTSRKKIRLFTWVRTKAQLVLSPLAANCKHVVLGVSSFACRVFQIYSKSVLCFRQAVPVSCQFPAKTCHSGYQSHSCSRPSRGRNQRSHPVSSGTLSTPTGCCLVTEHIKGTWTIRVDCVSTTDSLTRFVQLSTVLAYREKVDKVLLNGFE